MVTLVARHHLLVGNSTGAAILATVGLTGLPAWVALISGGGAIFGLAALRATASTWRGERNAERAKASRLEEELRGEKLEHDKNRHRLEVAEKKPDIDRLWDLMRAHDERTATASMEMTKVLQGLSANLAANTDALRLWATEQAQRLGSPSQTSERTP